jgi:hypothetical protein
MKLQTKNIFGKLVFLGVIGVGVFFLFFVVACTWIGYDVKRQCKDAEAQYGGGDCTESLVFLLNDEHRSYRDRNSAIWALGQLGDEKSLPVLESYYTGSIPEREPLNKSISQYELKKAIKLARGGLNITAFFWRGVGFDR